MQKFVDANVRVKVYLKVPMCILDFRTNVKVISREKTDSEFTNLGSERIGNRRKHRKSMFPVADVANG